jgi:hypothetical protein
VDTVVYTVCTMYTPNRRKGAGVFSTKKRTPFLASKREGEGLLEGGHRVVQWSIIQWVG